MLDKFYFGPYRALNRALYRRNNRGYFGYRRVFGVPEGIWGTGGYFLDFWIFGLLDFWTFGLLVLSTWYHGPWAHGPMGPWAHGPWYQVLSTKSPKIPKSKVQKSKSPKNTIRYPKYPPVPEIPSGTRNIPIISPI